MKGVLSILKSIFHVAASESIQTHIHFKQLHVTVTVVTLQNICITI